MGKAYERVMQNRKAVEEDICASIQERQMIFRYDTVPEMLCVPKNAATNSMYKGINAVRLMQTALQRGLTDNRWMTFNQAKELGYKIKSGSTGTLCEHWTFDDEEKGQNGMPTVSYYYLFNAADIEGLVPEESDTALTVVPAIHKELVNKVIMEQISGKEEFFVNLTAVLVKARYGMVTREYTDSESQDLSSLLDNIQKDKNYVPRLIKKAQEESDIISMKIDAALLEQNASIGTHEDVYERIAPEDLDEEGEAEDEEVQSVESQAERKEKSKIEDFGNKIGGARKDLWSSRGLDIGDLVEMNDAEREKFVTKDNIWKKPNYNKMIEEGMPVKVAYFVKKVRDKVMLHPSGTVYGTVREDLQKEYINFVKDLRDSIMQVCTEEEALGFCKTFLYDKGYVENTGYYGVKPTEKAKNCIDNKLFKAMRLDSYTLEYVYEREIKKKQFGVVSERKLPTGYEIRKFGKEETFSVCQGRRICEEGFQTWNAAKEWIEQNAKPVNRKSKFIPPQLEDIRRLNLPDVRKGTDITGEDYLSVYHFYGGEFGNWMSELDRQASLNMGYEAFHDLAAALHITEKDISLDGTLSIAFGARGHGNAAAHYEPLRKVINLTKMKGAGSLAHEWGHALDDYLGNALGYGKMLSEARAPEFKKVMDAMKCRPATEEERETSGRELVASEFYLNSKAMDGCTAKCDKGYWASDCEMFARAFACYVKDKLAPGRNDYLCGHAHACANIITGTEGSKKVIKVYPEGKERARINEAIDALVKEMKEKKLLSEPKETAKKKLKYSR